MKNIDLGITPEDAMPTVQEVARFFGVPPHMLCDETPATTTINVITIDELLGFLASARPPHFAKQVKRAIRRTRMRNRKGKIKKRKA